MSIFLGNLREFEETFKEEQKLLEVGVTASCMERRRQEGKETRGKKGKREKGEKRQKEAKEAKEAPMCISKTFCSALVALCVMDLPQSADIAQFYIVSSDPDTRFCPPWAAPISI